MSGYDAVIVGGRCAGSTLAIRLARSGWKVLVVDKQPLGSDTLSTHLLFPNTLHRLAELGVWERLTSRHSVPLVEQRMRILGREVAGRFTPIGGFDRAAGPTRPALDGAIAEAALDAGAEGRFGERVTGLIGAGTDDDPVRGVVLESGERIEARWVVGADGRASSVAAKLGLEKQQRDSGEMSLLLAYWRGMPPVPWAPLDALEDMVLTAVSCEDGITLLTINGPPEMTRGSSDERESRYLEGLRRFPEFVDPDALDRAERITEIRVAPETMLRGFFRRGCGPGWALVGDANHFKHPATAQGISDAVEQAFYVADALTGEGPALDGYDRWRDERAAGHYEYSFRFATFPREEVAGPIFEGLSRDPEAQQEFRDSFCRVHTPQKALSKDRLARWFSKSPVAAA